MSVNTTNISLGTRPLTKTNRINSHISIAKFWKNSKSVKKCNIFSINIQVVTKCFNTNLTQIGLSKFIIKIMINAKYVSYFKVCGNKDIFRTASNIQHFGKIVFGKQPKAIFYFRKQLNLWCLAKVWMHKSITNF